MTTKGLRYERFECDICHKKEKVEIVENAKGEYVLDNSYSITMTWTDLSYTSALTKKPDPEKIEMCESCALAFKSWRLERKLQNE